MSVSEPSSGVREPVVGDARTTDDERPAKAAPARTFSRTRRWLSAVNLAVIVLLSFYILFVVDIIVYFHPMRLDLTVDDAHTLSDGTRTLLDLVDTEIRVVIPVMFQERTALGSMQQEIFTRSRTLLDEYMTMQPRIVVTDELFLGSLDGATRWKALQEQYGLAPNQINCFIFLVGDEEPRRQVVAMDDIAVYDRPATTYQSVPPKIHKFRGEEAFTSALRRLIRKDQKRLYFVRGAGGLRLQDGSAEGILLLGRELESNGYDLMEHDLDDGPIPDDCDLLVVAGPSESIGEAPRREIQDYLLGEGRLLVLLRPKRSGLEGLLSEWGLHVPKGVVRQRTEFGQFYVWSERVVGSVFNPVHPVTRDFRPQSSQMECTWARPIDAQGKDAFSGEFLVRTAPRPPAMIDADGRGSLDEGEKSGQIVLAATVSKPRPIRPPPGYKPQGTRIAVFGAATPFQNGSLMKLSHRDLLLNTVRWLVGQEEELSGASGRPWNERRLRWSPQIHSFLFWVPIFVFPGLILCAGIFVYFLRRS